MEGAAAGNSVGMTVEYQQSNSGNCEVIIKTAG